MADLAGGPQDADAEHVGDRAGGSSPEALENLAAAWLEAERQAIAVGNANNTEDRARLASAAYDAAVADASPEELLLGWRAAEGTAGQAEMGSKAWAESREVAALLRVEYLAARS